MTTTTTRTEARMLAAISMLVVAVILVGSIVAMVGVRSTVLGVFEEQRRLSSTEQQITLCVLITPPSERAVVHTDGSVEFGYAVLECLRNPPNLPPP